MLCCVLLVNDVLSCVHAVMCCVSCAMRCDVSRAVLGDLWCVVPCVLYRVCCSRAARCGVFSCVATVHTRYIYAELRSESCATQFDPNNHHSQIQTSIKPLLAIQILQNCHEVFLPNTKRKRFE